MRETLFRGKRADDGKWIQGHYVWMHRSTGGWTTGIQLLTSRKYEAAGSINVDAETVSQYTGLRDKKGQQIFEGDIVRYAHPYKDRSAVCEIAYDGYQFIGVGFYMTHHDVPLDIFGEGTRWIEIIGNIYDNPELLKEGKQDE